jgi:two-component system response regulator FixJ
MGYAIRAYESGIEFLEECVALNAGCVLLDVRMPKMDGLEVQKHLQIRRPDLPVVVVTGHGDVKMAVQAMKAGAIDFIEKPFDEDILLTSVRNALARAEQVQRRDDETTAIYQRLERLTPRERDVFEQLIIGHANKVIARALDCSPRTVEIHRARVMEKMEATSVAQLVRMALAAGINIADD